MNSLIRLSGISALMLACLVVRAQDPAKGVYGLEETYCTDDLSPRYARLSDDGKEIVAITGEDYYHEARALVLDSSTGKVLKAIGVGHGVAKGISANGRFVVVAENQIHGGGESRYDTCDFRVYDLEKGMMVTSGPMSPWPHSVSVSDDGKKLLFALYEGVFLVDSTSHEVLAKTKPSFGLEGATFLGSDMVNLYGTSSKGDNFQTAVATWVPSSGDLKATSFPHERKFFPEMAFDAKGNPFISGPGESFTLYDRSSGNPLAKLDRSHTEPLGVSADGSLLLARVENCLCVYKTKNEGTNSPWK